MVRKDGAEARKERIVRISAHILAALYQNKGCIPLKKTIAQIAMEGLTRERILEYLTLIQEADPDKFEIDQEKDQIRKPKPV